MKKTELSDSTLGKGGVLVSKKYTIQGSLLRVVLAFALVLGLMPSLATTKAFADESANLSGYPQAPDMTVTFDSDGGTPASSNSVIKFDGNGYYVSAPSPAPSKAGFKLTGWTIQSPDDEATLESNFSDEDFTGFDTNGDSSVVLKAQWTEDTSNPGTTVPAENVVAKIGDVQYSSLSEAFSSAKTGETITMTADVDDVYGIFVKDKAVTLDMAGHKITSDNLDADGQQIYVRKSDDKSKTWPAIFNVENEGSSLTITGNGTIAGPEGEQAKALDSTCIITVDSGSSFTMTDGTITCGGIGSDGMYGVYALGGGSITLGEEAGNGPSITSHFAAVGENNTTSPANVTIYGGNYKSMATPGDSDWWYYFCTPVYAAASGNINISGGTFEGTYGLVSRYANVDQNLRISGGTFNGAKQALLKEDKQGTEGATGTRSIAVSGGSFSTAVPADMCAEGFEPKENGDGTFGVQNEKTDPVSGPYDLKALVVDSEGNPVSGMNFNLYKTGSSAGADEPGSSVFGSSLKTYTTDADGVLSVNAQESFGLLNYFVSNVKYAAIKSADKNYLVGSIDISNAIGQKHTQTGDGLLYLGYKEKLTTPRIDFFYRFAFDDFQYVNLDSNGNNNNAAPEQIDATVKIVVEKRTGVYKDDLQTAISKASALKETDYFSGWDALKTSLDAAKSVDADSSTTQDAVDEALKNLNAAVDGLVQYPGSTDSKIQILVLGEDGTPYNGDIKFVAYGLGDDGNATETVVADDIMASGGILSLELTTVNQKNVVVKVKPGQSLTSDDEFKIKVSPSLNQWVPGYFISVNGTELPYDGSQVRGLKCQLKADQSWNANDFTYDGATVTGLSDSGKAKMATDPNVVVPSISPDGTAITAIGKGAANTGIFSVGSGTSQVNPSNVTLPEGITSIGDFAFTNYAGVAISFPSTLKSIGINSFASSQLESLDLPDSVTTLGSAAFRASKNLTTLKIGKGITELPQASFSMTGITNLSIPENVKTIGRMAFDGTPVSSLTFEGNATVETIGDTAFGNNSLKELEIPASVKTIERYAFRIKQGATLEKLTLHEGLESIGKQAFKGTLLTELNLPSTVTTLDKSAFEANKASDGKVVLWVTNDAQLEDHGAFIANSDFHKTQKVSSEVTVTFNANGGKFGDNDSQEVKVEKGQVVAAPSTNPTWDKHDFIRWTTDPEGQNRYDFSTPVTGDITLYASWYEWEQFTVKFDLNGHGGPQPEDQIVYIEDQEHAYATKPADPTAEGYYFCCWNEKDPVYGTLHKWDFDDHDFYHVDDSADPDTGTLTLYARWIPVKYAISYKNVDGAVNPNTTSEYTIESEDIALQPASKEGYSFVGWFDKDGSESGDWGNPVEKISKGSTGNVELYARWIKELNVKFSVTGIDADGKAQSWVDESDFKVAEGDLASHLTEQALSAKGVSFDATKTSDNWWLNSITSPFDSSMKLGTQKIGKDWAYWSLLVNGEYSDKGAGQLELKEGDVISWVYEMPAAPEKVYRMAGDDCYGTNLETIKQDVAENGTPNGVIVCGTGHYLDSLSAAALSGLLNYPILLVNGSDDSINSNSLEALSQLSNNGANKLDVIVLGGKFAVSDAIESQLNGYDVDGKCERIYGDDGYATNRAVYDFGTTRGSWNANEVLVASGAGYHDALGAGSYAMSKRAFILLVNPNGDNAPMIDKAKSHGQATILGGLAAVPFQVQSDLEDAGVTTIRLAGEDAYQTNTTFVKYAVAQGMSLDGAGFSSGLGYYDALGSSHILGKSNSVMFLVSLDDSLNQPVYDMLKESGVSFTSGRVFGGSAVISDEVKQAFEESIK